MSKNFEIFLRAGRQQDLLQRSPQPAFSGNGSHIPLNLEALTREEQIKLVQRVFLSDSKAPRAVVFTGLERGAGCSWVCARAGETLADQVGGSVCVVDANLRSPSLHEYFGADNHCGLIDILLRSGPVRRFAQQLSPSNMWLVPCGSSASDPRTLMTSDRLRLLISELRTEFQYVLIDAPPLSLYVDAALLGQLADGMVMILKANCTHRETAWRAKESLDAANVRLLGVVLNKRTFPIPEAIYRKL